MDGQITRLTGQGVAGGIPYNVGTNGLELKGEPGLLEGGQGHINVSAEMGSPVTISTRMFQLGCDTRVDLKAPISGPIALLALSGRCRHCDGKIEVNSPIKGGFEIGDGTDGHLNYQIKVEATGGNEISRSIRLSMSGPWNLETVRVLVRGSEPADVTIGGIHEEASRVDIDPDGALRIRIDSTFSPESLSAAQQAYLGRHSDDMSMHRG